MFSKVQELKDGAAGLSSGLSGRLKEGWAEIPPPGKSGEIRIGCCCGRDTDCPYIKTLRQELRDSYYWSGVCVFDYFFFICQWHPLLGLFLCHPNHPWAKRERFFMILISLAITMVPSAFIGKTFAEDPVATKLFMILFVTIPDTIIGVILYQLSIADSRYACSFCACIWGWIQSCLMGYTLIVGGVSTLMCYTMLTVDGETQWDVMLKPLALGIGVSYLTWFPLWFILPCQLGFASNWCAERNSGRSAAAGAIEQQVQAGQE